VPDRPDLVALLTDPATVPVEAIPDTLAALEKARVLLWSRLTAPAPPVATNGHAADEVVDDVHEVARLVRRSVSWVRKRGHTLPGFHQPGGRATRVAWVRGALEKWATTPTPT
jgi:hypothetical protein